MNRPIVTVLFCTVVTTIGLTIPGCASPNRSADARPDQARPATQAAIGTWSLVSLNGKEVAAPGTDAPWFTLSPDGAISGFTAVNRFSTRLTPPDPAPGQFRVGPMAATRMAGPPERMQLESDFSEAFGKAERFTVHADTLTLTSPDGITLVFKRANPH